MHVLLIYTHPNHTSFNFAIYNQVLKTLKENGKDTKIRTTDLYEEGFEPALIFNANKKRRNMHEDPELIKYREDLLWADHIVFIYPIWWGRPPAMLLGYIDKLITANFAYKYNKPTDLTPVGLFKGKKVTCISTMNGPTGYPMVMLNNAHKVLMKRGIFKFIGIKKVKFLEFGNVDKNGRVRDKILEKVRKNFL